MKVRDKTYKQNVNVYAKDCLSKKCYWPRIQPGSFQIGRGYQSFGDARDKEWICGTRAIHGCPDSQCDYSKKLKEVR